MFYKRDLSNYKKAFDGVKYKTLTYGHNTSLGEFHIEKGYVIPTHKHPQEQTGYVVSGQISFYI